MAGAASAQMKTPQASPAASVTQTIGITDITINWSRPGVKGREIWGKLVPFGQVWRAGANMSTVIEFTGDVTIDNKTVPAGKYSFFTIPQKDSWTMILSKNPKQMGAFEYKESEDLIRWTAKPSEAPMTEWLLYTVTPETDTTGTVTIQWEKLKVSFTVTVDLKSALKREIAANISKLKDDDFRGYANAATAYFDNDIDVEKALEWAKKSVEIKAGPGNLRLLGRILVKKGNKKEGVETLNRAIKMMQERPQPDQGFIDAVTKLIEDAKK